MYPYDYIAIAIAQDERQFGRSRVCALRAGVCGGRVGRDRADPEARRACTPLPEARTLPVRVRRARQSLRALRSPRALHFELLASRCEQRHERWRI